MTQRDDEIDRERERRKIKQQIEENYSNGQQRSRDDKKRIGPEYQRRDEELRKRLREIG